MPLYFAHCVVQINLLELYFTHPLQFVQVSRVICGFVSSGPGMSLIIKFYSISRYPNINLTKNITKAYSRRGPNILL